MVKYKIIREEIGARILYQKKVIKYIKLSTYINYYLTISFSKENLVGGCSNVSKTANFCAFSMGLLSVSMNLSNSGCDDGNGIDKVASRTRLAILRQKTRID